MYAVINAAYLVIPCSCFIYLIFLLFTLMLPRFALVAGCHLHTQHSADQCQRSGTGTTGAGPPSAAAPGHDRLPGTCWAQSELHISPHIAN